MRPYAALVLAFAVAVLLRPQPVVSEVDLEHRVFRLERQVDRLESEVDRLATAVRRLETPTPHFAAPRARDPQRWAGLEVGMTERDVLEQLGMANGEVRENGTVVWVYGGKDPADHPHVVFDAAGKVVVSWQGP